MGQRSRALRSRSSSVCRTCSSPTDGYFYAQIGWNLGTRGVSSFDNVHTTDGYHLPWALVLAAVSFVTRVVTQSKTAHLFVYLAVSFSLIVTTARAFFTSAIFRTAGFLGFFSGLDVVDGDGLVNDHDYARRLDDESLAGYLDEQKICYLVVAYADAEPVVDAAGLRLTRAEVTLLHAVRRRRASQSDFVLYRIDAERCADGRVERKKKEAP